MAFIHKLGLNKFFRLFNPIVEPIVNAPAKARLAKCCNTWDLRKAAEKRTHQMCFGYLDSGADDEIAIGRSRSQFSEYECHYRVLAGNSPETLDMSTTIFGRDVRLPFFCCPTAGHRMFHNMGEKATAAAAAEKGILFGLSSLATTSVEDIGKIFPKSLPKVFQLYLWKDKGLNRALLQQAREYGYDAVALTADFTWFGKRERDIRNGFSVPPNYSFAQIYGAVKRPAWTWDLLCNDVYTYANIDKDVPAESMAAFINKQLCPDFNWQDAEWLANEWGGELALKGVVRQDDAVKALDHGFTSLWVSNHGGRQLETSVPTIDALPGIRQAVGPDVEIILDGGVMRGTDIAKAIAMGADAVGCGKAYLYGLAAGGKPGVVKAIDILEDELERAMGLLGAASVQELKERGPELIRRRNTAQWPPEGFEYSLPSRKPVHQPESKFAANAT
ncbi:FMN-dependent dehydrogenase [Chloropicon primus]|uniref:FMN-dependent dehydrogenase n=3 Tax=Chloropicon primus TaxID=1764295 RepID=A0A5B8MD60_9CHLO|nr:FMN-dependent dehydrogenase [Chloropicon primus]UPQ97558.1 FMN-dependent dehydrogenase [Chloropicon primus]|eukprot:QDZ18347.1 FMN-dependent dehydrogenase [Chloropicon primus]